MYKKETRVEERGERRKVIREISNVVLVILVHGRTQKGMHRRRGSGASARLTACAASRASFAEAPECAVVGIVRQGERVATI